MDVSYTDHSHVIGKGGKFFLFIYLAIFFKLFFSDFQSTLTHVSNKV